MPGKQQNMQSFELRSEKTRSIVGQIPSSLMHYGITIIGAVLLCLLIVASCLPHQQIYSGIAIAQGAKEYRGDSIEVLMLLRFNGKRLTGTNKLSFTLSDGEGNIARGQLLKLSSQRDTLERQEALCLIAQSDWLQINGHAVDFQVSFSTGTLLYQILGLGQFIP